MQVLYGDHVSTVHHSGFLQGQLEEVLPVAMATSRRRVEFERRILAQHSRVSQSVSTFSDNDPQASLYKQYLQKCCQWPFYGAAFFHGSLATKTFRLPTQVKIHRKAHVPVNIAVNTSGFHLISLETNSVITSLSYDSVDWDASAEKHCVQLSRSDKTLHVQIKTRMAGLFSSLVSRMSEQYLQRSHGNTSTTTSTAHTQND
ncbi:Krev interaction trapped protein 1 [Geodia barretti]|nr:Krev interaction trapped protein 1 [Geodia barretti]